MSKVTVEIRKDGVAHVTTECKECGKTREIVNIATWLCAGCARKKMNREFEAKLAKEVAEGKATVEYCMIR